MRHVSDFTSAAEVERLLHHMPECARQATDGWTRQFASGMAQRARWRNWQPSPKQIRVMRRMVADLFAHARGESVEVIE